MSISLGGTVVKSSILINGLCLILRFCKIPTLYNSYVIIHEVYLNNLKIVLEQQHINENNKNMNIINKTNKEPVATRVFGPIARELRELGYNKVVSLAEEVL